MQLVLFLQNSFSLLLSYDEINLHYFDCTLILVGVSTSQEDYLKFLFEGDHEFCVLPTYVVIPALLSTLAVQLPIDLTKVRNIL